MDNKKCKFHITVIKDDFYHFDEVFDSIGLLKAKYSNWFAREFGHYPKDYLESFSILVLHGYSVSLFCLKGVII